MKRIIPFILILISCNKNNNSSYDYFIFGRYYGFCVGEKCIEIFKLENNKLFEDNSDEYPDLKPYSGNFKKLDNSKYTLVKDLPDHLPVELTEMDNQSFGCPDCTDQGGLFIQYKKGSKVKYWKIDQYKEMIPIYLYDLVDKTNEYVDQISD